LDIDRVPTLAEVRLVHRLVCHVTPVMYSHYLLRRLRTRVARTERLRLARELHDGVVQSLAGLEMHVEAMRRTRRDEISAAGLSDDLARLQQLLGDEARAVREVMNQIRPLDIGRGQAVRVFEDLVTRFSRESGIEARFSTDADGAGMLPRTARELGRTLQESLRNIRKHAGARRVDVEFRETPSRWQLVVENDGRPFGFIGRKTLEELEAIQKGPRVIKERVRELGGDLAIHSSAQGVRLDITVPRHLPGRHDV
jgi:signal transduction histidine kinase